MSPPELVGVKFDMHDGLPSKLLGRCSSYGPSFELDKTDRIVEIAIRLTSTPRPRIIEEVVFATKQGIRKGLKGDTLIEESRSKDVRIIKSISKLTLGGLAWSFDLGASYIGDHGIQPLYLPVAEMAFAKASSGLASSLYPSIEWTQRPPPHLHLRPIPDIKSNRHPLTSSLHANDDETVLSDTKIISIRIYFNAFLQGIIFQYKNGTRRIIGNTVGSEQLFELDEERIFTVEITSYVQYLPTMSLPRETVAIEGLRVRTPTSLPIPSHVTNISTYSSAFSKESTATTAYASRGTLDPIPPSARP